jgi:hypothetical protein
MYEKVENETEIEDGKKIANIAYKIKQFTDGLEKEGATDEYVFYCLTLSSYLWFRNFRSHSKTHYRAYVSNVIRDFGIIERKEYSPVSAVRI